MVKLFKEKSEIQKIGLIFCSVMILGSLILGTVAKSSYSTMSQNPNYINNATVQFDNELAEYIDYENLELTYDVLKQDLDSYGTVFVAKVTDMEYCYNCTKYTVKIIKSIKGSEINGNNAILYQWGGIDKLEDKLIYSSYDNSLPLQKDNEYLIFSEKRCYDEDYQKTLECNEYSMGLRNVGPTAFILNKTQQDFINISDGVHYGDLKDKYYTCFSQKALDNVNKVSAEIICQYT